MFNPTTVQALSAARLLWARLSHSRRTADRRRGIEEELPEFLRFCGMALRAGWSIRQILGEAAGRLSGPLAGELALAAGELSAGLSIDETLRGLADRADTRDAASAAAVLGVALRQGGDAAAALDSLATVSLGRLAMRREIESLTAQARFSAVVLGVLPVGFWLFFPGGGGQAALRTPMGWLIVGLGLALDCGGYAILRWLAAPERLC